MQLTVYGWSQLLNNDLLGHKHNVFRYTFGENAKGNIQFEISTNRGTTLLIKQYKVNQSKIQYKNAV